MATNQESRHAAVRTATGTAYDYNGDWMALFDQAGIAVGEFNGRLLAWLNSQSGITDTNLPDEMQRYAVAQGALSWDGLATIGSGSGPNNPLIWRGSPLVWRGDSLIWRA